MRPVLPVWFFPPPEDLTPAALTLGLALAVVVLVPLLAFYWWLYRRTGL